jgi:hydroxypyruvate isomerase
LEFHSRRANNVPLEFNQETFMKPHGTLSNPSPPKVLSASAKITRRSLIKSVGSGGLAAGGILALPQTDSAGETAAPYKVRHDRIHQSVISWCYRPMPDEELIGHSARMGLRSVELVAPKHWPQLRSQGMVCAIAGSHGFSKGFAHVSEHAECLDTLRRGIDDTSNAGFPSIITFSGYRRGLSEEEGTKSMVAGLKQIAGYAEKRKVTVCLEMLNSRVNVEMKGHPDYFCDDLDRTVNIVRQVGSERVKVLFDIYHVQIMHGDLISRVRQYHPYIGHYHTAGVPGRNEIDPTQEINYLALMKAILDTGYQGFVGQEFIPLRDPVTSLSEAVRLCDI